MGFQNIDTFIMRSALALFITLPCLLSAQDKEADPSSLAEAFNAGAPEVEPVVIGRDKWNEGKKEAGQSESNPSDDQSTPSRKIEELDALETKQIQTSPDDLKIEPPKIRPATQIVRNFEGTLVFKPRKLGFAYDFPYQLENSRGKRLAFVDVNQLKGLDPQDMVEKSVNVMGKLEPVEEGSDDLVIRARIIRLSN
jgi:hypothetical protein